MKVDMKAAEKTEKDESQAAMKSHLLHESTRATLDISATRLAMVTSESIKVMMEWYNLMAKICFWSYNYQHFNGGTLPLWCYGDSLLGEKLESAGGSIADMAFGKFFGDTTLE